LLRVRVYLQHTAHYTATHGNTLQHTATNIRKHQPVLLKSDRSVLLGVIECVNKKGSVFDEDDKYVMDIFATITAAALENLSGAVSVASCDKPVKSTQTTAIIEN